MPQKNIPLAIVYDFDGTIAPGNMQERDFFPDIGVGKKKFWSEVTKLSKQHNADNILMYMYLMLKKAEDNVPVRKSDFKNYGKNLTFFDGVTNYTDSNGTRQKSWFDRINTYGKDSNVKVDHYIISSGIKEMIEGTSISNKFRKIFASSFRYDQYDVAQGPALSVTYTAKTQYLFRINKGVLDVYDHSIINDFVDKKDRPVPFENMVFIGDGETDVPCFRLVKEQGGHSIAVYKPNSSRSKSTKLKNDGRVNFVTPAIYKEGSELDRIVKGIIDKIQTDSHLYRLG